MNWTTGNHSYGELVGLLENLKHLKYFPPLDPMVENVDSLRIGIKSNTHLSNEIKGEFKDELEKLAISLDFGIEYFTPTVKFFSTIWDDLTKEQFSSAFILEQGIINLVAKYNYEITEPEQWHERGFVPENS